MNDYTVLLPLTLIIKSLVVHVLFYCILMNIPNLNLILIYVVFLAMVMNINVFVVGIQSLNNYVCLILSLFGNIICFLVFLYFIPPYLAFTHSSPIPPLIYFLLGNRHMTLSPTLPVFELAQSNPISMLPVYHLSPMMSLNLHLSTAPPR